MLGLLHASSSKLVIELLCCLFLKDAAMEFHIISFGGVFNVQRIYFTLFQGKLRLSIHFYSRFV